MLEGFEDLDFPLKVPEVFCCAVLKFLHCYHLSCAVLQGVIPAHLHTAKVSLQSGVRERTDLSDKLTSLISG